jgi:hypothetical protein
MCRANEPRLRAWSGSTPQRLLASAALAAVCVSPATAGGGALDAPQLAARVNGSAFEFRGMASIGSGHRLENHIWRFSRDGKVTDVGTVGRIWYFGGYSDQPLPLEAGTWKLAGSQICTQWSAGNRRFNGCYDVLAVAGRQFALVGPQILNGTMETVAGGEPTAACRRADIAATRATTSNVMAPGARRRCHFAPG